MRKLVAFAAAALAAAGMFTSSAFAGDPATCNDGDIDTMTGPVYLAHDPDGSVNLWVYLESGAAPGLQRGGVTLAGESDTCQSSGGNWDTGIL